jgi:hypothetical protein
VVPVPDESAACAIVERLPALDDLADARDAQGTSWASLGHPVYVPIRAAKCATEGWMLPT